MNRLVQGYRRLNRKAPKLLWLLVIASVLLSLPLAVDRYRVENSSKKVEFVFDYRDLLEMSDYQSDPRKFVKDQYAQMKRAGIHSLAVYESTLSELKWNRRIEFYSSHEVTALTQTPPAPGENFTYVLFTEKETQPVIQELVERSFKGLNVNVRQWSYQNQPGLILELPVDDASMKPMDPDPVTLKSLKEEGFNIVARLGNRRPVFISGEMDAELQKMKEAGVQTVLFDGDSVPGFSNNIKEAKANVTEVAKLLKKNNIAIAAIELQKTPQKGFDLLAKETDYNVIRLHSFTEKDADKLTENISTAELDARIKDTSDRFVLAVKDRNIRLVFLNAKSNKNLDRGTYTNPLPAIYKSLEGQDGAVHRIKSAGFVLGPAHPFAADKAQLREIFQPVAILGSVALIALTLSYFVPSAALLFFALGVIGSGALYPGSPNALEKLLALAVGICGSSLGLILAIRSIRRRLLKTDRGTNNLWLRAILTFIGVTAVSGIAIVLIVGLLNDITYNLLIDQFKGVKILAYMPVLLVALYLVFFSENLTGSQRADKLRRILKANVSVLWVLCVAVIGAVGFYYLSRTGNEGTASPAELMFRSFLENTLGVRPRTKEFLISHPLLLLGLYLSFKRYANGIYLLLAAAIGQASVVGTFTHLHTPLLISFQRVVIGAGFGLIIGIGLIIVWEIGTRGWNKWVKPVKG